MLLLTTNTHTVELTTSSAADIQVTTSYVDNQSGTTNMTTGSSQNVIASATTTTIVNAPASGSTRNVKNITISNVDSADSCMVTVVKNNGTQTTRLSSLTLLPNEALILDDTGTWTHYDQSGAEYSFSFQGRSAYSSGYSISGAVAETFPRSMCGANVSSFLVSGSLSLQAIYLYAGQTINSISFFSGGTAVASPTNGLFGLYDVNRNLLASTVDFGSEAWASNTMKTKSLTAPYRVPVDGLYYVGIALVATTLPTLAGISDAASSQLAGQAPVLNGVSSGGITTTLPNPAAAITQGIRRVWAAVS